MNSVLANMSRQPAAPTWFLEAPTPLGPVWLTATDRGLCGLWFTDQRHAPQPEERASWMAGKVEHPLLNQTMRELEQYFDESQPFVGFTVPLDTMRGTPFQRRVWAALLDIEPGHPDTYGAVAQRLGLPTAVRAVGAAVGRNPISIIVPCHRVIGKNGQLTGYAGGLERKRMLLQLESSRAGHGQTCNTDGSRHARHPSVSLTCA